MKRPLFLILGIVALVAAVWSFMAFNAARNETLDQRVHDIAEQLKCPVCQGESVADSPSMISQQMRGVIRQQLQEGRSEQQIIQYFVDRYGEKILWSPPWQGFTLLAWLVPIALLLLGTCLLVLVLRDWSTGAMNRARTKGEAHSKRGTWTDDTHVDDDALDGDAELVGMEEEELERYRAEIEEELAASDPIFTHQKREVG